MAFVLFHDHFPAVAERETRTLTVFKRDGLPDGSYAFIEMFCDEPGCDCRRVLFQVMSSRRKDIEAVVGWGWEKTEFYAKWFRHDDPQAVAEMKGPVLNLLSPQSSLAPAILELVKDVLLKDPAYIERIKRHYAMFRDNVGAKRVRERRPLRAKRDRQA
jgi:hypothetical protein